MKAKPIQIAVVGAGLAGRRHINAIAQCDETVLSAVADPAAAARDYADKIGVACYESLTALLAKNKPDGIIIATPNRTHIANGMLCVQAGCPLLVEKPLAVTAADAEVLVRAAAAAGVPLAVGHHRRHNPLIAAAQAVVGSGKLGRLRTVDAKCWLYKPPPYFDEAPWRKQRGAGPVAVNLVHDADLLQFLCGDVVSVQAQTVASAHGYDNEDVAAAVLRFADDVLGTLTVSDTVVAPWSWELAAAENPVYPHTAQSCYWLGGDAASLSLPDLTLWDNNGTRSWWQPLAKSTIPHTAADPFVRQIRQFADVIIRGAPPLVSGESAIKTLRLLEAISQSARTGKQIRLPTPETRRR